MIITDLAPLLKNNISRYSLVTATAKRAREIADKANADKILLEEKPVTMAVDELLSGEYVIIEPKEIRNL